MALIKEPYGLVYNTDGTLCTTYRDDEVPFRGVRSFAVEEATTNLFALPFDASDTNWDVAVPDPTGKFENVIRANPGASYIYKIISTTIDLVYSGQVWCYVSPDFDGSVVRLGMERGGTTIWRNYNLGKKGTWQLLKIENRISTGDYFWLSLNMGASFTTGYALFANLQTEQKSYCTSYVKGSRSVGRIDFRNFSVAKDDFVLSYWLNFQGKSSQAGHLFRLYDDLGQLAWPYTRDFREFCWGYYNENNSYIQCYIWTFFTGNTNEWQNIVIILDENGVKLYCNGQFKGQFLFTRRGNVINRLYFYTDGYSKLSQSVANLYIGKYRRPDGTVIWTDDYIREVYEAQIPFPVSNKLSIY